MKEKVPHVHSTTDTIPFKLCLSEPAAAAESLQSCPTLCNPIDGSPPGSPVTGILQARTLEWVAVSFSNAWKWKVKVKLLSRVRLFETPWTAAHQAPPSMGFSRQEYWSGVPLPSPFLSLEYKKEPVLSHKLLNTDPKDKQRPYPSSEIFIFKDLSSAPPKSRASDNEWLGSGSLFRR